MNKNLKRILSIALAIGIISAVAPATNVNLLNTKAYASETNDEDYLDSLDLYDEDSNKIKLYTDSDYDDIIDEDEVEEGETYYAKSPSDTVSIEIDGPDDKFVKIFSGSSSSSKGEEPGDDIDLSEDSATTLIVKVYAEEPDDDIRYNDNDDYDVLSTYRVRVEYTGEDEDTEDSDIYLERLSIDNNKIELSESQTEYTYNVDKNIKEVTVRATPEDDDYDVTIDDKRVHSADNYKKTLNLNQGTNEFQIKIEEDGESKTYTLIINRGEPSKTTINDAEGDDNIYLERLSIDGKTIPLLKSKTDYTYKVDKDDDKVIVRATPEDEDYDVIINGEYADSNEDYKKEIYLNKGANEIKIEIEQNLKKRVYTLVINRGQVSANSTSGAETETYAVDVKANQWIQTNGKWQYNDASGNSVKNNWMQNYYLNSEGNIATGWLNIDGSWYYLGTDGTKKIGWQSIDGNWYYLDSQGKIKTGWFKDTDGKYYYLNSFGAMLYNTTIDGYKLGSNGAWTGK